MAVAAVILVSGSLLAGPQVTVSTEESDVVIDGNYVRIEDEDGVREVTGDWRTGGNIAVTDTDRILVELGAVEAADHIRLALQGDILFDFGSSAIRADAARRLAQVAHVIRQRAVGEVLVVGHTDSVGDDATNQKLSEARALSVIRHLNGSEGIPVSIMAARGLGEKQPVAYNAMPDGSDNPSGRAQNRRVELFLATTERADVRNIAGVVKIDATGVDVAGVAKITEAGVTVGDVAVTSTGTVATGSGTAGYVGVSEVSCAAGKICNSDCPEGDCRMTCPAGAICTYACSGGDCRMECSAGANCTFSCDGGDCVFSVAQGASCRTSCNGGDCTRG
jgi:outer membrane protein OmpA-like peptidoglycan-associated protein